MPLGYSDLPSLKSRSQMFYASHGQTRVKAWPSGTPTVAHPLSDCAEQQELTPRANHKGSEESSDPPTPTFACVCAACP